MRMLISSIILLLILGCSKSTKYEDAEVFHLGSGRTVGSCSQGNADEICRGFGYARAINYECGSKEVGQGSFWGSWEQDYMYEVTCWGKIDN